MVDIWYMIHDCKIELTKFLGDIIISIIPHELLFPASIHNGRIQQPQRVSRHGHHPFDAAEGEEDQLLLELIVVRHVVQQVGLQCWRQKRHHFLENGPVLK